MAQSPDDSAGDGEKTEAAKSSSFLDRNLPVVVAPKLGAGEDEAVDETADEATQKTAAVTEPATSSRFLMLAATVAFAAAFGSFIGSVSGSGTAHVLYPAAPTANTETAYTEGANDTLRAVKQQLAELSIIKANLDAAARSNTTQFAKLADRLDRIDQHTAAVETTGSIANSATAAPEQPAAVEPPKVTDRILADWIVHDVRNGRALVESRNGGLFDVGAGSVLPGIGRVDGIKRQDGQWLVLTARGTITSGR